MKTFHRRDRVALITLRLIMGILLFEGGIELLRSAWGTRNLIGLLEHWLRQPVVAPEVIASINMLLPHTQILAQLIVISHLICGMFLILGLLSRSSALLMGVLYLGCSIAAPSAPAIVITSVCLALALSGAGTQFSVTGLGALTRANHQSTETS